MYVENDKGRRIVCGHPLEMSTVAEVLGKNATKELIQKRTGFNSDCICLDCCYQYEIDVKKDKKECPFCDSNNIKTVLELVGKTCPMCKEGIIEEHDIGIRS